jgi:hypothetical protein
LAVSLRFDAQINRTTAASNNISNARMVSCKKSAKRWIG